MLLVENKYRCASSRRESLVRSAPTPAKTDLPPSMCRRISRAVPSSAKATLPDRLTNVPDVLPIVPNRMSALIRQTENLVLLVFTFGSTLLGSLLNSKAIWARSMAP